MDRRKCLLGIYVLFICGIIHVLPYEMNDIKIEQRINGYAIPAGMIEQVGAIIVKGGQQSLYESIASVHFNDISMKDIQLQVTVPQPENEDTCYMVAAFLSPVDTETGHRSFPNKTKCEQLKKAYDMNMTEKYMPTVSGNVDVLDHPICIKYPKTLDWSELIGEKNSTHCGLHTLVIMVDPFNLVEDDADVCNNYLTVDINFDCSDRDYIGPTCEVLHAGPDDKDVSLLFINHERMYGNGGHHFKRITRAFNENEDGWAEQSWEEEMGRSHDIGMMGDRDMSGNDPMREKKGKQKYGVMAKVLKAYVVGQLKGNHSMEMCSGNDFKNSIKQQLDELQSLQHDNSWEESLYVSEGMLFKEFLYTVRDIVDQMHAMSESSPDDNTMQQFKERVLARLNMYVHDGIITNSTAAAALTELRQMLLANKTEYAKTRIPYNACKVSRRVEYMMHSMLNKDTDHHDAKNYQQMHDFAKNISSLTAGIMFFYPDFYDRCYKNILMHLNDFVKQVMSHTRPDPTWMFDSDFIKQLMNKRENMTEEQYYEALLDCGKLNPCVRKLRSMCHQTESRMGHEKSVNTIWKDVCIKKMMKELVSKHVQRHLEDDMMPKNPIDAVCHSDGKMRMDVSTSMVKIVNGTVYRGALSLDNSKVIVQPIARCTCQKCDDDTHYEGDYDHKGDHWDDNEYEWDNNKGHDDSSSDGSAMSESDSGESGNHDHPTGKPEGERDSNMPTKPPPDHYLPQDSSGQDPAKEQPTEHKTTPPPYYRKK